MIATLLSLFSLDYISRALTLVRMTRSNDNIGYKFERLAHNYGRYFEGRGYQAREKYHHHRIASVLFPRPLAEPCTQTGFG